jgi:hypothetical protein
MRRIMLVTALIAVSPLAYAQSIPGSNPAPAARYAGAPPASPPMSNWTVRPPDPDNCGTPDQPSPCPPMPRHPLPYFPNNR